MSGFRKVFAGFVKCEQGLAYVEFALSISLMLVLFMGAVEVSRCMLIMQKLEKTVATVADVTTQTNPNTGPITTNEMSQLMSAVDDMMSPYSTGPTDSKILVIVSDITKTGTNAPVLNWQYCGGGGLTATSRIATTVGSNATLPGTFTMAAGEEVVIGEVFYNFTPITATNNIIGNFQIYKTAIYMPRLGALTGFASHC